MMLQGNPNKTIQETDLSPEFKEQSEQIGISTLRDFMDYNGEQLRAHPNFSQLWYTEMLRQLLAENLLDEFQGTADH